MRVRVRLSALHLGNICPMEPRQMRHLIHTRGKIGERLVYRVLRSLLVNIAVTVCIFTIANTQLKRFALLLSLKMHFQKAS